MVWKAAKFHKEVSHDQYHGVEVRWEGTPIANFPVIDDSEREALMEKQAEAQNTVVGKKGTAKKVVAKAKEAVKTAAKTVAKAAKKAVKAAKKVAKKAAPKKVAKKPVKKAAPRRRRRSRSRRQRPRRPRQEGRTQEGRTQEGEEEGEAALSGTLALRRRIDGIAFCCDNGA